MKRTFTETEKKYLRDNWGKIKVSEMAHHLDRHPNVIYRKAQRLGIYTPLAPNLLTDEHKAHIIKQFKNGLTDFLIAEQIGRARQTVTAYRISQGYYRRDHKAPLNLPSFNQTRNRMLYGAWK